MRFCDFEQNIANWAKTVEISHVDIISLHSQVKNFLLDNDLLDIERSHKGHKEPSYRVKHGWEEKLCPPLHKNKFIVSLATTIVAGVIVALITYSCIESKPPSHHSKEVSKTLPTATPRPPQEVNKQTPHLKPE